MDQDRFTCRVPPYANRLSNGQNIHTNVGINKIPHRKFKKHNFFF